MSTIIRAIVAGILVATAAAAQIPPGADWERADAETVRLAPEKIEALPLAVRQELTRLGCTIPQERDAASGRPHNFITGRFFSPSQTDIAVLCSRNRVSWILVFSPGSTRPVAQLQEVPDQNYLQVVEPNGRIGFSRLLGVANAEAIRRHHADHDGPELPPLDHDGIEDAFTDKASSVWYWYEGRWLQLAGSD